jgi:hypothetical protein
VEALHRLAKALSTLHTAAGKVYSHLENLDLLDPLKHHQTGSHI